MLSWKAVLGWWCVSAVGAGEASTCSAELLARYVLTLSTFWSQERFPKHYPQWRPHAQWSKLIGATHGFKDHIWTLGNLASDGLKDFAEKSHSDLLEASLLRNKSFVFRGPKIEAGVGMSRTEFFADSMHPLVSFIVRMIPSPDWFIGVDSLPLCEGRRWRDTLIVDLGPVDAGTDLGLTFTAPHWAAPDREPVSPITSTSPAHPASSFYYPEFSNLPPVARVRFQLLEVYKPITNIKVILENLTQSSFQLKEPSKVGIQGKITEGHLPLAKPLLGEIQEARGRKEGGGKIKRDKGFQSFLLNRKVKKQRSRYQTKSENVVKPCKVGSWSIWSPCSKTCGFGQSSRSRQVVDRGLRPCPTLQESRTCGSARNCRDPVTYFHW